MENLIPKHGGYQNLKTFQLAQLIFDITARFCVKFIDSKSRTRDQMVQAARSGVQNIAEGSETSGTSKKSELRLTGVARASLVELLCDYKDFLRQRKLEIWPYKDPRAKSLIDLRCSTADEFVTWVRLLSENKNQNNTIPEIAANGVIVLLSVALSLLARQMKAQADSFQREGGFTERLYRMRQEVRGKQQKPQE